MKNLTIIICLILISFCIAIKLKVPSGLKKSDMKPKTLKLPFGFKKCDMNENDFNQCLKDAVQNALKLLHSPIPEIGLPSFKPYVFPMLNMSRGEKVVDYDQNYTSLKFSGFTDAKVITFDIDFKKTEIRAIFLIPNLIADYGYHFKGNIFSEPIDLKGVGHSDLVNTTYNITAKFEENIVHGVKYIKIVTGKTLLTATNSFFKLQSKDTACAQHFTNIYNTKWQMLFYDARDHYEKVWSGIFIDNFNKAFSILPVADLFGAK